MTDEVRKSIQDDIKTAAETCNMSAQLIKGNGFVSRDSVFMAMTTALIGIGQALVCIAMENLEGRQ